VPAPPPASSRTRASALPVEERRAAIVAAALPLFMERGGTVTSREIAEAAGIAEGTIFRVFDDKHSLIEAIVDAAYDTGRVEEALDAIDRELPIELRLQRAVDVLIRRSEAIFKVTSALATMRRPEEMLLRRPPQLRGLARLLEPDAGRLACTPEKAARLLRALAWAASSRTFSEGTRLTRAEIVDHFLYGVLRDAAAGGAEC
jgi:AcrR family transcriptional regulator